MSLKKGSWPGGPRSRDDLPEGTEPASLETVEEMSERKAGAHKRARSKARRRSARRFVVLAALTAGIDGYAVGLLSHATTEEIVAEWERERLESQTQDLERVITDQGSRVIQEMWLSEIMERQGR